MKKLVLAGISILAVILLISASLTSVIGYGSVKGSQETEYVEVTTQACGVSGFGNTTVRLTKQQYQEIEKLFSTLEVELSNYTNRQAAVSAVERAVTGLNHFGLLPPGMSVKKAEGLVLSNFIMKKPGFINLTSNENACCLFYCRHDNAYACCRFFIYTIDQGPSHYLDPFFLLIVILQGYCWLYKHIYFLKPVWMSHPLQGYAYALTLGLNGFKDWNGKLIGGIRFPDLPNDPVAARGFSGLQISPKGSGHFFLLGSAIYVNIIN